CGWKARQLIGPILCPMKPSWYLMVLMFSPVKVYRLMNWLAEPLRQRRINSDDGKSENFRKNGLRAGKRKIRVPAQYGMSPADDPEWPSTPADKLEKQLSNEILDVSKRIEQMKVDLGIEHGTSESTSTPMTFSLQQFELQQTLRGLKRTLSHRPKEHHPITPEFLLKAHQFLDLTNLDGTTWTALLIDMVNERDLIVSILTILDSQLCPVTAYANMLQQYPAPAEAPALDPHQRTSPGGYTLAFEAGIPRELRKQHGDWRSWRTRHLILQVLNTALPETTTIPTTLTVAILPNGQETWQRSLSVFYARRRELPTSFNSFYTSKHFRRCDNRYTKEDLLIRQTWSKTIQVNERDLIVPILTILDSQLCPVTAYANMLQQYPAPAEAPALDPHQRTSPNGQETGQRSLSVFYAGRRELAVPDMSRQWSIFSTQDNS
ncbi:hypothetical protein Bbelb_440790, partial [Branchiostoma belcheri]